ncbi:hypothetical protein C1645_761562, partial [Glomus cerebriforme]
ILTFFPHFISDPNCPDTFLFSILIFFSFIHFSSNCSFHFFSPCISVFSFLLIHFH